MIARLFVPAILVAAGTAAAQLPASGTLSERDWPLFRAEVARLEKILPGAPDRNTITYEMAQAWASAKQWPETMQWLRKVADLKAGLDPSRDSVFSDLHRTREFSEILTAILESNPPVSHSTPAFQVAEGDLVPESMAYDARTQFFYFGSMRKGKVVRCSSSGDCSNFADGLGVVLGLKVQGGGLWLASNSERESALIHYDLASGRMVHRYSVAGAGHQFNDLAISPAGDVYLTDTPAGLIWHLANGATELTPLDGKFRLANGIALSPDARLLYVSVFPDGIDVVDLKNNSVAAIGRPPDLCLATIDGLCYRGGSLIAIQNGIMLPRIVRLRLSPGGRAIERFEILERRNPLFQGITTGVLVNNDFFYMANVQDEKTTGFEPIRILKLPL